MTPPTPPSHPFPATHSPRFRFPGPRAGPAPLPRAPQRHGAGQPGKKAQVAVGSPPAGSLPFSLTTSALSRQHGRCGCLAKLPLISCGGAASLRRPSRFPALPASPRFPPPFAPVSGAGGLIATWGRASAAGARLPVRRRPGGRRWRLCPRPLRRGDRAPGRIKGFILCRCAKSGPAPPWPQCSWRTTSWSRLEAVAGPAVVPRQPLRLLLQEPPWRRPLQRRPARATG